MIKPPRLQSGSTIGIANVSGPVDEARLDRGIEVLRAKGYCVVEAPNVRKRDGFLAGSDAERAAGYLDLVRDRSVDAIFFARGGYGATRILRHLDGVPGAIREHPKIHLGGSDLTALYAFLAKRASLVSFYGPMIAVQLANPAGSGELDWESVLLGQAPTPERVAAEDVVASGRGEGVLVGGCLSLLAALCGTPDAIDARGAVLFWEDVGEGSYRLDRMLTQLERSGTFDGLQAMVIGSIAPGRREGAESPDEYRSWLAQRFAGAPFPVAAGFPAGHLPLTRTLPLGTRVRVDLEAGVVEFLESGVV